MYENIAIIGSSGAIGGAFVEALSAQYPAAHISAFSRSGTGESKPNVSYYKVDYSDESSIAEAAEIASKEQPIDLVIVATGILHEGEMMPEKSLRDLSHEKFQRLFEANTITPALVAKHFLPKLQKDNRAVFAALSAKVGSVSDNYLGGWYAYRASKAALNMIIKNSAIEMGRRYKKAIIVGLHPGTVDSELSKPFQKKVPDGKLFTPEYSASQLISVINGLSEEDTGKCFAWDGEEINP